MEQMRDVARSLHVDGFTQCQLHFHRLFTDGSHHLAILRQYIIYCRLVMFLPKTVNIY